MHAYIYIYIFFFFFSKFCPKLPFFESIIFPNCPFSLFVFQNILLSAGRSKSVQCCATCLDRFLTRPWPDFWQPFSHVWPFFPFLKICWNPYFIGFSAETNIFVAHPPKIRNTICEHNCANWFFLSIVFCILGFGGFCCVRFLVFFERNAKLNTKQPKKTHDHKMQTRKPLRIVYKKKKADNTDTKQCNFIV